MATRETERAFLRPITAGSGAGDGRNQRLWGDKRGGKHLQDPGYERQWKKSGPWCSRANGIWEIPALVLRHALEKSVYWFLIGSLIGICSPSRNGRIEISAWLVARFRGSNWVKKEME